MTVELLMNPTPPTLRADETVAHALQLLLARRHRVLPVVDPEGRFVGMFGVHHLLESLLPRAATVPGGLTDLTYVRDDLKDLRARVRELGTRTVGAYVEDRAEAAKGAGGGEADEAPALLRPGMPLLETLLLLYRTRSSLPVVDEASGRLLGVVFYWEVFGKLARKG